VCKAICAMMMAGIHLGESLGFAARRGLWRSHTCWPLAAGVGVLDGGVGEGLITVVLEGLVCGGAGLAEVVNPFEEEEVSVISRERSVQRGTRGS